MTSTKQLSDKLRNQLNKEYVRRLLIRYFIDEKGLDRTFEVSINPAIVQDLPAKIPQLAPKVEVVPYPDEIDIATGKIMIGWNLFVLGTNRMFLGTSTHKSIQDLMNPEPNCECHKITTPKEIVDFITDTLSGTEEGMVDPTLSSMGQFSPGIPNAKPKVGPTSTAAFYEKKPYGT